MDCKLYDFAYDYFHLKTLFMITASVMKGLRGPAVVLTCVYPFKRIYLILVLWSIIFLMENKKKISTLNILDESHPSRHLPVQS